MGSLCQVTVDGLNYFTGDWGDRNQSHYNPQFRDRLTLSAQAVLLGFPAVQVRRQRHSLHTNAYGMFVGHN
jgi:hypothetical protein